MKWKVLTGEFRPAKGQVFFGLTPEEYQKLAANQADLLRWVTEAYHQLQAYQ